MIRLCAALALLIGALSGCSNQLMRDVCRADGNCRYICPDGSTTDPRYPNCPGPAQSKSRGD